MSGDRIYIDLETIMERIRVKIRQRGAVGIRGLGRLFRIADDNGDKSIGLEDELPKLLGDIGVLLNRTEIAELGRMLDRNGDKKISYDEFLYYFAPKMSDARVEICNKAFDSVDKNGNGVLELEDLKAKQQPPLKLGQKRSAQEDIFNNLLNCFDKDGNSTISKQEFLDYYREISPSIDHDDTFCMMIKSSWGLE